MAFKVAFEVIPTIVSTALPPLKRIIVGMARIPCWAATASWSSMFTFPMATLLPISVASSSRMGAIALQGPHQGAQKSTSTGVVPEAATAAAKDSVVRWATWADIRSAVEEKEEGKEE